MHDEGFFRELIDNSTEGIYFLDRARRITYWNRGAERLTGYPADEVVGRCCADGLLQHMDPNGRLLCNDGCPMEATMRDGRERAAEIFLHHKQGHRVPITVRAFPIRESRARSSAPSRSSTTSPQGFSRRSGSGSWRPSP